MISDTGLETNDEFKCHAKAILSEMGPTLTSVHGVNTSGLLNIMIEGSEKAGLSSGLRYAAAAIIVAYKKGKESDSSAPELTELAEDWLLFFLWPFKKFIRTNDTPRLEVSTPTSSADTQGPRFQDLISKREGDKCAFSGFCDTFKGPYDSETYEGVVDTAHIIRTSTVHEDFGCNRITETFDIIKQYTNFPTSVIDNVIGIIDSPENGMLLENNLWYFFNNYAWCLHPTDVLHRYTVHWLSQKRGWWNNVTEVQFQNLSQTDIPLPDPRLIALHAAVAHILCLSGATEVIDKVHNAFFDVDEDPAVDPPRNRASGDDLRIRLSLIELMTNSHQLPTNPHGIHKH
ncbi:hypothetical protein BDR04DRAFT_802806 [Suillus decipiens]|nr:hypothetical protein BDR04DRAFT_802806 [Suillus decipiens]